MKHDWEYKKIGEICDIKTGKLDANAASENGIYPFFTCSKETLAIDNYSYDCECVLIAGNGDLNVKYYKGKFDAYQRTYIIKVKSQYKDVSTQYLYQFFCKYVEKLRQLSIGGVIKYIKLGNLTDAQITVPPIEEQTAICSLLDKLSLVIEKKKQQVKELDNLAQAIFYDMFGDVNTNNHSYDIQTLSSVCEILTDGTHQTPEYTQDIVNGVKFLSAKDVVGGVINWNNIKYIPQSLHESLYSRLAPKRNDILLCKNGTTGIAAVVETDEIFDIYVSLALLRLKDGYLPKYILYAINNPTTKQQFDDSLKGVGVPNLHLGEIKKTRIVVPPLPLQQSFAQKVESIERQKELINQSIREAETLFDSRMEYYFGE